MAGRDDPGGPAGRCEQAQPRDGPAATAAHADGGGMAPAGFVHPPRPCAVRAGRTHAGDAVRAGDPNGTAGRGTADPAPIVPSPGRGAAVCGGRGRGHEEPQTGPAVCPPGTGRAFAAARGDDGTWGTCVCPPEPEGRSRDAAGRPGSGAGRMAGRVRPRCHRGRQAGRERFPGGGGSRRPGVGLPRPAAHLRGLGGDRRGQPQGGANADAPLHDHADDGHLRAPVAR